MRRSVVMIASILSCTYCELSVAAPWNLPSEISNNNAKVNFEVDSTWHLIKGHAEDVRGQVWLEDRSDYRSVHAKMVVSVSSLRTGSESRDKRMREVMHSEEHPEVVFTMQHGIGEACSPSIDENTPCKEVITGDLNINGVVKSVVGDAEIIRSSSGYSITGTTVIKWPEFNVEDPSIFIAKLHEEVKISFQLFLAQKE